MNLILIIFKITNLILKKFVIIMNLISYYFDINININNLKLNEIIINLRFFHILK